MYASYAKVLTQGQSAEQEVEWWQATRGLDSLGSVNYFGEGIKTLTCASSRHAFMGSCASATHYVLCIRCPLSSSPWYCIFVGMYHCIYVVCMYVCMLYVSGILVSSCLKEAVKL